MARSRDIGQELVAARQAGVPWKALSRRYKLSRSRLYQLWWKAEGRRTTMTMKADSCACPRCGHAFTPR